MAQTNTASDIHHPASGQGLGLPAKIQPEESFPSLNEKTSTHSDHYEMKTDHKVEAFVEEEAPLLNDGNPFPPMPGEIEETQQVTVRAIVVGSLLGLVVGASNIYLGLKTGFTFAASLFGAIFGFGIIKPLSHILPERFGGGYFGPKENCAVQTAATSAGGLTALFVSAVPAMYQLKLLNNPKADIGRLFLLTAITAFYGLFFAIPLRKYYILKEKLVFPTPTATAFTIRSLHSTTSAAARIAANKKIMVLLYSFIGAFVFKSLCGYAPGLLLDWHIFYWFYTWGWGGAIRAEAWGWMIEITPAFVGAGILSGLNASWSFMLGSVLAWGLIGPLTIKYGGAVSKPNIYGVEDDRWRNYQSMTAKDNDFINNASPRYWLLWVGILVMLCYSFAELACNAPLFYRSIRQAVRNTKFKYAQWRASRQGVPLAVAPPESDDILPDPAPESEQVRFWMWSIGLAASVVGTLVVGKLCFDMDVGIGILALIFAFILTFIGVQSSGTTDTNPIGVIAKASQLVVGGVTRAQNIPIQQAQLTNLFAGAIAGQAAAHGVDMTGDLKTGHLLRASPRAQFYSQILGSVFGIWLSVGLFVLFSTAYPCIIDLEVECTNFGLPAVSAWRTVAIAVTTPTLPIPPSSGYTAIALSIVSMLSVVIKHTLVPRRYHHWMPNWNAVGLGFVVPQTYFPLAMVVGAHLAYTWGSRWPKSWEIWGFALSAGMIAGEGMGGVVAALFTILKIDGSIHGSAVACPVNEYCG